MNEILGITKEEQLLFNYCKKIYLLTFIQFNHYQSIYCHKSFYVIDTIIYGSNTIMLFVQ